MHYQAKINGHGSSNSGPSSAIRRGLPPLNRRAINFICHAPTAQSVSVVGDFNQWNPAAHRMKQLADGGWQMVIELKHGHHRYAFLVDGVLTLDPMGMGITRSDKGERVSLMPVS